MLAGVCLLWPAVWNGYPIVFADTGTYLSQAINQYAGWDRPVFYSLFMLPLHATITVWPVVVAQALITAYILHLVCRSLLPRLPAVLFLAGVAALSATTWLPFLVSELTPDIFTPLLILVIAVLIWTPDGISWTEQMFLTTATAFMISTQLSSLPLSITLVAGLSLLTAWRGWYRQPARDGRFVRDTRDGRLVRDARDGRDGRLVRGARDERYPGGAESGQIGGQSIQPPRSERYLLASWRSQPRWQGIRLALLAPLLAVIGLCTVNLAAHGRFAVAPFGNVFLLARVIYDGPGLTALRQNCPASGWRLCPYLDRFPHTSDDFLWSAENPLDLAGGAKAVSHDADAIILAALRAEPMAEAHAMMANTWTQFQRFSSGDGLEPWPRQVTPWINRDFPAREQAAFAAARQQRGGLVLPADLASLHKTTGLLGLVVCLGLLPRAFQRRSPWRSRALGVLVATLLALPVSAAITGALSAPHDRYQSRIMWLPPFVAVVAAGSMLRRTAAGSLRMAHYNTAFTMAG